MRYPVLGRCVILLTACLGAQAADAPQAAPAKVASWSSGVGTVADRAVTGETAVAAGELARAGKESPVRIDLAEPASGSITLAPGSAVRLAPGGAGNRDLVVEVVEGAAQLDLSDKGTWRSVLLRSGGVEARALRSLALAEHTGGTGYIALVRGALQVHGTEGKDAGHWVPLKPHQGIPADGTMLGAAEDLAVRPQIDAAQRGTLHDQGKQGDDPATWHRDAATAAIAAALSREDATAAAWIAASLAKTDSQAGADVAARAIARVPELAADFAAAVVACAPSSANDVVTASVGAVPEQAAPIVGAVAAVAPDNAADLTVAALTIAPAKAKDIVLAAVKAAPGAKDAIIGVASALAPEAAEAAQAAP